MFSACEPIVSERNGWHSAVDNCSATRRPGFATDLCAPTNPFWTMRPTASSPRPQSTGRGATPIYHGTWVTMPRPSEFAPLQAQELNSAFSTAGVDYLFIGKSGAILLGYPGTTQDIDLFLPDDPANSEKVIAALETLGFVLDEPLRVAIRERRHFVQIKSGPF